VTAGEENGKYYFYRQTMMTTLITNLEKRNNKIGEFSRGTAAYFIIFSSVVGCLKICFSEK
jgi:hypothetical protein